MFFESMESKHCLNVFNISLNPVLITTVHAQLSTQNRNDSQATFMQTVCAVQLFFRNWIHAHWSCCGPWDIFGPRAAS